MMKSCIPFVVFVFLGCAAFVLGEVPIDDDDFMFEGSGRAQLPTTTTTTTTTTSTTTTSTAAPELDGSGSGDGMESDDEDYYDYEDYDYDVGPTKGVFGDSRDTHLDSDVTPERTREEEEEEEETKPSVHALPPATEPPVHRDEHHNVFGAVLEDSQTPEYDDAAGFPEYPEGTDSDISISPEVAISGGEVDVGTDDAAAGPAAGHDGLGAKPIDRNTSFFAQPGILAAVVGGAVVGLLCAILLVMLIVYRMRKKDEGSYPVDEPAKQSLTGTGGYQKNYNKEFYA